MSESVQEKRDAQSEGVVKNALRTNLVKTVLLLSSVIVAFAIIPVHSSLRILDLSSQEARESAFSGLFRKPKMSFVRSQDLEGKDELEVDDYERADGDIHDANERAPDGLFWDLSRYSQPSDAKGFASGLPTVEEKASANLGAAIPGQRDRQRRGIIESRKVLRVRKKAQTLKMPEVTMVNPCAEGSESRGCDHALSRFYEILDSVDDGRRGEAVRILVWGNSLIASDHVTDKVRENLQERFGDGGRGYLLLDRLHPEAGRRVRTGRSDKGWTIHTIAQKKAKPSQFGIAGSYHSSTRKGQKARWRLDGARRATIWTRQLSKGGFDLFADDVWLRSVDYEKGEVEVGRTLFTELTLPAQSTSLRLVARNRNVDVFGVELEKDSGGIVMDTIGVPAADAGMYESMNPELVVEQVVQRQPDLVVFMLGGNEIRSRSFGWKSMEDLEREYRNWITRIREAQTSADCLAIGPIDAAKARGAGAQLKTRPEVEPVIAMQKRIAAEAGCAYIDLFAAMGAKGSLQRMFRKGLIHDDLVHPRAKGADILGQQLSDIFFADFVSKGHYRLHYEAVHNDEDNNDEDSKREDRHDDRPRAIHPTSIGRSLSHTFFAEHATTSIKDVTALTCGAVARKHRSFNTSASNKFRIVDFHSDIENSIESDDERAQDKPRTLSARLESFVLEDDAGLCFLVTNLSDFDSAQTLRPRGATIPVENCVELKLTSLFGEAKMLMEPRAVHTKQPILRNNLGTTKKGRERLLSVMELVWNDFQSSHPCVY